MARQRLIVDLESISLAIVGITFEGTAHRGVNDARQIARIAGRLRESQARP